MALLWPVKKLCWYAVNRFMEERKHAPWIKIINLSKGHNMSGMFKQGTSSFELFSWPFPWPSPVFQDLKFSCYNFPKLSFGLGYFFLNNSVQQSQPLTSTKMCVIHGDNIQRLSKVCWKLRSFAMNLTVSLCSWQSKWELWNRLVNLTPHLIA